MMMCERECVSLPISSRLRLAPLTTFESQQWEVRSDIESERETGIEKERQSERERNVRDNEGKRVYACGFCLSDLYFF